MRLNVVFGKIVEVADLKQIKQTCLELDSNALSQTLVIFDVDSTLIVPKDMSLRDRWADYGTKTREVLDGLLEEEPLARKYNEEVLMPEYAFPPRMITAALMQAKQEIIDPKSVTLIESLAHRGVKTIALTAAHTGPLGVMPAMEDWRVDHLKSLGYDFSRAFPESNLLSFPEIQEAQSTPIFKQGILFSSTQPKGEVLAHFLKQINWMPKKIIFVDDNLSYVQSVGMTMSALGVEVIGFYYTAVDSLSKTLDLKLCELQFRHLIERGEWLSDKEAADLLAVE